MNSSISNSEVENSSGAQSMNFRRRRLKYSWKTAPNFQDVIFGWAGLALAIVLFAATIYLIISRLFFR